METIAIDQILIPPNRIRQTFDPTYISDLADTIADKGLINPVTVRDDGRTLVAGENRMRACYILHRQGRRLFCNGEIIPAGCIAIVRLSKLDPLKLREAELEENTKRRDLTWQEKASAARELHQLRLNQTSGQQTLADTAREITGLPSGKERGQPVTDLSDAILVSKHLDDPDIASAPDLREAKKRLTRKLEAKFREALVSQHGFAQSVSQHTLHNGDALDILDTTGEGQFDCIITDPPYGIGAHGFGSQATTTHQYLDDEEATFRFLERLVPLLERVTKAQAHLYMFCDPRFFNLLRGIFYINRIFDVWSIPIIWHKSGGMLPSPDYGPRRTYETILFANKGQKMVTGVYPDVVSIPSVGDKSHAAEKPLDLYVDLLRRSCGAGDSILDCCGGSGVVLPAANRLGLRATYIELDKDSYNLATLRQTSME